MEVNPYQLLGVSPETPPEDIKRAYRQAALRRHPDSCPDRPDEAAREFCRLAEAYHWLLRRAMHLRAREERVAYTPQDFFRQEVGWDPPPWPGVRIVGSRPPGGKTAEKVSYPTLNENVIFICFWLAAIGLSMVVTFLLAPRLGQAGVGILALTAPLGTYTLVLSATVAGLILTRRVVWRIVEWGLAWRPALPGPKRATPLPRRRWWRLRK